MWRFLMAMLALVTAGAAYCVNLLHKKRNQLKGLVCLQRRSVLWPVLANESPFNHHD
jgi:hypothetical protein